jgi:hypothetical protein
MSDKIDLKPLLSSVPDDLLAKEVNKYIDQMLLMMKAFEKYDIESKPILYGRLWREINDL